MEGLKYELVRSSRKTIAIQVGTDGAVTVRAPRRCKKAVIEMFITENREWIARKKEEMERKAREQERKRESLPVWNEEDYQRHRMMAGKVLQERVAFFAELMGVDYGRITVRDQRTRWGSCSVKGNLNFNWRLILAPGEVLDYVVVHELAHRREMNHSDRFWRFVEVVMPDYQWRRAWLKTNGSELMAR